jgi:hypothetical protein
LLLPWKALFHHLSIGFIESCFFELASECQVEFLQGVKFGQLKPFLIFKLEEEEKLALLLHLLKVFAETAIFGSTAGLGCRLVEATVQPTQLAKASSTSTS